jgi:exosortase family protein XrtM
LAEERESRVSDRRANDAESQPSFLIRRAVGFVATFTALQLVWQHLSGSRLEYFVLHTCTVQPAALLANVMTPEVRASASGYLLQSRGVRLNILNGCDGLEALFLVFAAFTVAPLDWRRRLGGAALGVPVVFAVNQARVLTLFYAFRSDPPLFASLHATVTPIAVIVLVCCYFYAWLAYPSRRSVAETA